MKKSIFICKFATEIFKLKLHCLFCASLLLGLLDKQFGLMECLTFRSSQSQIFYKTGALKIFAKCTGKPLWLSGLKALQNLLKVTLLQVFSYEVCEIFKSKFFTEHLRATTSAALIVIRI